MSLLAHEHASRGKAATAVAESPAAALWDSGIVTVDDKTPSKLYALIIGIDTYPCLPHLTGAVADADEVSKFLTIDLGVPDSRIINLRNEEATRESILGGFEMLRTKPDTELSHGSPILIYFAGHGGVENATGEGQEQHGTTRIQVIFPYDYNTGVGGKKVNCIKDKTVAKLLNELSHVKGDNITVIFDSCHSASGSRTRNGRQARNAKVELPIPADIDEDILVPGIAKAGADKGGRYTTLPFCTHQTSHIHLAACSSEEQAWEDGKRGIFTAALLKTIRAHGVDKVTYRDLVLALPRMIAQTPHCYGAHRSRILFNKCVPSRTVAYIPVIYDPSGSKKTLTLQAGAASGVTRHSLWELHTHPVLGDEGVIGVVRADSLSVSIADLSVREEGDHPDFWIRCEAGNTWDTGNRCEAGGKCNAGNECQGGGNCKGAMKRLYARLVQSGPGHELKVWFSPEAKQEVFPELKKGTLERASEKFREFDYVVHPTKDYADMLVDIYHPPEPAPAAVNNPGAEVEFRLCDERAEKYDVAILKRRKAARQEEVEPILFAAARWNRYLRYTNQDSPDGKAETTDQDLSNDQVDMEMFRIAERARTTNGYSDKRWWSVALAERKNIVEAGLVDFEVYEKDLYAVRLTSKVDSPLYVRMFYFDTTTFCIDDLFGHSAANGRADPVIDPRGKFTIGDDRDGGTPLPYGLDEGEMLDLGYLKVFWSTDPLELDSLKQQSAFEMKGPGGHTGVPLIKTFKSVWGTKTLTLVQRAPANAGA